jgi:hypothetical protein
LGLNFFYLYESYTKTGTLIAFKILWVVSGKPFPFIQEPNTELSRYSYLLEQDKRPDAAAMVSLLEALVRDIILHLNPTRLLDFDGALLPFSWARMLARKYKGVYNRCDIECLGKLFASMKRISSELRFGLPGKY